MVRRLSSAVVLRAVEEAGHPMDNTLSRRMALGLFAAVVMAWGLNWIMTKILVQGASPLWAVAIRSGIATVTLFVVLAARRQLVIPRRGDWPVIVAVAVLHMSLFTALVAFGLQLLPVGRSIVLGYTTPLWVAPIAWLALGEVLTKWRIGGIVLGLAGVAVMFNPLAFDWFNRNALIGNGMLLLASLFWAVNIVTVRGSRGVSAPFQLVFWQAMLATLLLTALALVHDGLPQIAWSGEVVGAFLFAGVIGTALAHWAMLTINQRLPATVTSLGLLATPVFGVIASAVWFGEPVGLSLIAAMAMIIGGIVVGTVSPAKAAARPGFSPAAAQPSRRLP
jgi:drug/metabolite transporter (DMT)-like permease